MSYRQLLYLRWTQYVLNASKQGDPILGWGQWVMVYPYIR
jgi:hypothetical protein